jgi:hypothetical protein
MQNTAIDKNWNYESVFRKMSPLERKVALDIRGLAPNGFNLKDDLALPKSSNPIKWVATTPKHAIYFKSDGRKHSDYKPENYRFLLEYRLTPGSIDELKRLKSEGTVQRSKKGTFGIPPEKHPWFNNRVISITGYDLLNSDIKGIMGVLREEYDNKSSSGYILRGNKAILFQAFSPEFLENDGFSRAINLGRMSWLKTSLLWTLYRSEWGRKFGQERILEIEVPFDYIVQINDLAITTKQQGNGKSPTIYQTDPDRRIIGRRWLSGEDYWVKGGSTKHYGIRNEELAHYVNKIVPGNLRNITEVVQQIELERPIHPTETLYDTLGYNEVSLLQLKHMQNNFQ